MKISNRFAIVYNIQICYSNVKKYRSQYYQFDSCRKKSVWTIIFRHTKYQ